MPRWRAMNSTIFVLPCHQSGMASNLDAEREKINGRKPDGKLTRFDGTRHAKFNHNWMLLHSSGLRKDKQRHDEQAHDAHIAVILLGPYRRVAQARSYGWSVMRHGAPGTTANNSKMESNKPALLMAVTMIDYDDDWGGVSFFVSPPLAGMGREQTLLRQS